RRFDAYGRCFGQAFQITDDLLDVEGCADVTGKRVQKDAARGKLTYPGLLGVVESRQRALELCQQAHAELGPLGSKGTRLAELVRVLSIRPAHFASNLGVVELCLALHLTFDFSRDRLIWDTGHQIYPHKLITGRYKQFETIRTRGGLMGYPNPQESPYDLFMTGHAGCSLSCALGLKVGDELLGHKDRYNVAV